MAASPRLDLPGSSLEAEFGGTGGGVRESPIAAAVGAASPTGSQSAPPKATSAPKGNTKEIFTGLGEALNTYQQKLKQSKKIEIADIYEFEFAPATMGDAKLKRQGTTNKKNVPMQDNKTAKSQKDPATNSFDSNTKTIQVSAGMQIMQLIDQVIRNSTYITDQQTYVVDEVTQQTKPNPNPPGGITAWYKVTVATEQLGYDKKRRDHAYRMKFIITPYAINTAPSDWFKNSRYRGSHKSYNYWFTGANKEILNFEQEYNNLYRLVISGTNVPVQTEARTDFRGEQYRRTFLPTSDNAAKGAEGYTNEAGDNLASYLYSPTDQAKAKLRIVGDPAWMQQGEVAEGVSARTFDFAPFNNDGTINYDSQEVVFDISWNAPSDYDFNTGLMDLSQTQINSDGTRKTLPKNNFTYTAIKCKNIFSKGRFEQDLEGRLLIEYEKNTTQQDNARPGANNSATTGNTRPGIGAEDSEWVEVNGLNVLRADIGQDGETGNEDSGPNLLSAPPPAPPTSDGTIQSPFAGQTSVFAGQTSVFAGQTGAFAGQTGAFAGQTGAFAAPPNASAVPAIVQDSASIQQIQAAIARNRELIAAAAPGSPVSNRLLSDNRSLEASLANLGRAGSIAPGVRTTPQKTNRET
jgi:hypothetical protein